MSNSSIDHDYLEMVRLAKDLDIKSAVREVEKYLIYRKRIVDSFTVKGETIQKEIIIKLNQNICILLGITNYP